MKKPDHYNFAFSKVCKNGHEANLVVTGFLTGDGQWTFDKDLAHSNMFVCCPQCGEPLYPEVLPALQEMHAIAEHGMKAVAKNG